MPRNMQQRFYLPVMSMKDLTLWMAKQSSGNIVFPYRCERCGKGYQHRGTLLRHTRHECGKEPKFKCPYCPHKTKQRGNLYQHIRMIAWQSIHQYHQNQMTSQHKILHNSNYANPKISQLKFPSYLDKKPGFFECPNCGKYYRWLRNMRSHLKIECGKDPKECCPFCPHRTKYKSSLKYACQWCGRSFSWPSSLRLHQKMACGKPPNFHCTVCDYKSNFKGNLKRHLFCKHNIDLY
ncbi:zinc finger protein 782-like [Monomorium pharaonis]|uniref:zinc finger protein 782-like n=1 Tax=Monomorium pharaonis TaxID=307658 RepID=UPI0017461770|nr:zinc finger protein 782-like [Monomorium pharaonis]